MMEQEKEAILKTYHRESKFKRSKSSFIGSILLIVSTILPCLDVIFKRFVPGMETMRDSSGVLVTVDIWLATLYISPAILVLAATFKPNPKLYFLPLFMFFYTGTVYFSPILGREVDFFMFNSWLLFIISILASLCYMYVLKYVRRITIYEDSDVNFQDDLIEQINTLSKENIKLKTKIKSLEEKYEGSKIFNFKENA